MIISYPYSFFLQHNGVVGHIAHALGIVEGFNKEIDVTAFRTISLRLGIWKSK